MKQTTQTTTVTHDVLNQVYQKLADEHRSRAAAQASHTKDVLHDISQMETLLGDVDVFKAELTGFVNFATPQAMKTQDDNLDKHLITVADEFKAQTNGYINYAN